MVESKHTSKYTLVILALASLVWCNHLGSLTQPPLSYHRLVGGAEAHILKSVAICESNDRHLDEDGSVLLGELDPNDIGRYQINKHYWGDTARTLGLDLYDEQDNEKFAYYLYGKYGLEPWSPSKKCRDELALLE